MQKTGRELHSEAAKARESELFTQSLTFNDDALFAYDKENDALGFSEGIACRSITLRVYANLHDSKRILTLAKYEMMASVELARESGQADALALPLFNLASINEDLGEFEDAVADYKEALENIKNNPPPTHDRPSVIANFEIHLAACEYKAGDKTALQRAENALAQLIEANEPDEYSRDVWISGGYMRIADAIKSDDKESAKEYLQKAKEIIDSNPKLSIRKKQLGKLYSKITG